MNIQPKIELGAPPGFHSINPNDRFEKMSIHELVNVLRGTYQWEIFDSIEGVLESRNKRLREDFQMEKLSRLHAEAEFKKREEMCEKGKKVQESYEALLKEVKVNRLADSDTIKDLRKKNDELEAEVVKLNEKCVDGSNEIDVLKRKNGELEDEVLEMGKLNEKLVEDKNELAVLRQKFGKLKEEVLELRKSKTQWLHDRNALDGLRNKVHVLEMGKLNEKLVEDKNELGVLREKFGKLEEEVLELRKSKAQWLHDRNALDGLRNKVHVLEGEKNALAGLEIRNGELNEMVNKNLETIIELQKEKSKLADGKSKIEVLLRAMYKKFRTLVARVSSLENDTKLLMNGGASGGGNNEGEPSADRMGAASEEKDEEDYLDSEFRNDTVEEAVPSQRNEAVQQPLGVAASTQPHSKGSEDDQGASSDTVRVKLENDIEVIDVPAKGRVTLEKGIEIINLDGSDNDDDDQSMSQVVHEKKAISGIAAKKEDPSSSVAAQRYRKIVNDIERIKRKFSLTDIETSSSLSTSFDDSSSLDDLPIRSVVSLGKKKKM